MGIPPYTPAQYAASALLVALTVAGRTESSSSGQPARPTPAPQKASPAGICVDLLSYWAKETIKGDKWPKPDGEQKGLSNEQYAIHKQVVAAARAKGEHQGRASALTLINARTSRQCAAQNGVTGSSENWRDP